MDIKLSAKIRSAVFLNILLLSACGGGGANNTNNTPTSTAPLQTLIFERNAGGSQTDIYAIKEDGSGLQMVAGSLDSESFYMITEDGRLIFSHDNGGQQDISIIQLDGTGLTALADSAERESSPVSSSYVYGDRPILPDGKIVFERESSLIGKNFNDLFIVNADGSGELELSSSFAQSLGVRYYAKAATNSGRVIFERKTSSGKDLYSILTDGSGLIGLEVTADSGSLTGMDATAGRVVFMLNGDLFIVNADGTDPFQLTASPATSKSFRGFLPDGRILFTEDSGNILSVKPDGTGLVSLAGSADVETLHRVTADGKVVYSRNVSGTQNDLYIVNSDGSGTVQLTSTAEDDYPAGITGDGKILFSRSISGQLDLFYVNQDGTGETRLTDTPESESWYCPTTSACEPGGRLVFTRSENTPGAQNDVYSMNPDGSSVVVLLASPDEDYPQYVTPNGRVVINRQLSTGSSGIYQFDLYSINADGSDLQILSDSVDSDLLYGVY